MPTKSSMPVKGQAMSESQSTEMTTSASKIRVAWPSSSQTQETPLKLFLEFPQDGCLFRWQQICRRVTVSDVCLRWTAQRGLHAVRPAALLQGRLGWLLSGLFDFRPTPQFRCSRTTDIWSAGSTRPAKSRALCSRRTAQQPPPTRSSRSVLLQSTY